MATVKNNVSAMAQTLEALGAKQAALVEKERALHDEERTHALDAHSGDAVASERLARIHDDLRGVVDELRSVGIALEEAKKKFDAAQEAQRIAAEQTKARKAEALLPEFEARARHIDALAIQLREEAEAFVDDVKNLNHLGVGINQRLVEIAIQRSIDGLWMGSALAQRHLTPAQRHTLDMASRGWVDKIRAFIGERIETKRKAA